MNSFKSGDRVVYQTSDGEAVRGTVDDTDNDNVFVSFDDGGMARPNHKALTRDRD